MRHLLPVFKQCNLPHPVHLYQSVREGGMRIRREGGREGEREGGRERGREGGREGVIEGMSECVSE